MKEHFCPVENTLLSFDGKCNWCGEKEESMTQETALKLALETLEKLACLGNGQTYGNSIGNNIAMNAIAAIKEALAQERTWVKLEGEEIRNLWEEATKLDRSTMTMITSFARAIESKMKELNT